MRKKPQVLAIEIIATVAMAILFLLIYDLYPLLDDPLLSTKDAGAQTLAHWLERPESDRFRYRGGPA